MEGDPIRGLEILAFSAGRTGSPQVCAIIPHVLPQYNSFSLSCPADAPDSSPELSTASRSAAPSKATAVTLSPEEQLSGDMLMLTTGFMMCAAMLWLAIYWSMGYQYSTAIPLLFQGVSALTIWLYWRYGRLEVFAYVQLGLILFTPFAMQWSIGNFVNASGVALWGLMAPVGAVTVLGRATRRLVLRLLT